MEEAEERVEAQIQADSGMENQNQDNTIKKEDKDKEKTTLDLVDVKLNEIERT